LRAGADDPAATSQVYQPFGITDLTKSLVLAITSP